MDQLRMNMAVLKLSLDILYGDELIVFVEVFCYFPHQIKFSHLDRDVTSANDLHKLLLEQ